MGKVYQLFGSKRGSVLYVAPSGQVYDIDLSRTNIEVIKLNDCSVELVVKNREPVKPPQTAASHKAVVFDLAIGMYVLILVLGIYLMSIPFLANK